MDFVPNKLKEKLLEGFDEAEKQAEEREFSAWLTWVSCEAATRAIRQERASYLERLARIEKSKNQPKNSVVNLIKEEEEKSEENL